MPRRIGPGTWPGLAALAGLLLAAAPAAAQDWPGGFAGRVEALAVIQSLNATILASPSATLSLEDWCRDHRLADPPRVVIRLVPAEPKPPGEDQLHRLNVGDPAELNYRRVELRCGRHILSEADNWYVPARLTAEMNHALETTDTPFGKIVQPLKPYRRTFAARLLWSPLPAGWERADGASPAPIDDLPPVFPPALFEHRAVLYTAAGQPFSEVDEVYRRDLLAFQPRRP
jgi:hypothetical protein